MAQDNMVGWCTFFLTFVGKEAPAGALDEDTDERERNHWWKSKKWAYANLNRLFVRYVLCWRIAQTISKNMLGMETQARTKRTPVLSSWNFPDPS